MKQIYLITLLMLSGLSSLMAQENEAPTESKNLRLLIELTASFGGEPMGTLNFTNGTDQTILSGNGLTLSAGADYQLKGTDFGVKAMAGYKFSSSMASNADIKKTVIPVDIVPYYAYKNHRVGPGLHYHIRPSIDWDTLGDKEVYNNALGFGLEYMYVFNNLQFAANYTVINYQYEDALKLNASHFNIKAGLYF